MRLRSPILARMPTTRIKVIESAGRISLRLLIGIPILIFILLIVFIVWFELLPERGIGAFLYGVHDQIYLPIKGYTYTRFFPQSLIWWGLILTTLLLITISLLTDRSLIKGPHIYLLKTSMRNRHLHGYLIHGSRLLGRIGIRPQMVRAVARREWEADLITLSNRPLGQGSEEECLQISALTRFLLQLDCYFPVDELTPLRSVEIWHRAYLLIDIFGEQSKLTNLRERFPPLAAIEENDLDRAMLSALNYLEPAVLLSDLHLLVEAINSEDAAQRQHNWFVLVNAVEIRRRDIFDTAVINLERSLGMPIESTQGTGLYQPAEITNLIETVPVASRIALSIALHVAFVTGKSHLARAYVEAIEALDFLLAATVITSPAIDKLQAMIAEKLPTAENLTIYLPLSEACRTIAKLELNNIETQEAQWEFILLQEDSPVKPQDFIDMRDSVEALYQAAGPATANDTEVYQLVE